MEDAKLVEAMLDVINSGSQFKANNGFKPGFFNVVEQHLAISLPNSGIKAKPHIESRIKTLKSDWSAVHDMLSWNNTSGFGWDYINNMLDAPIPVWQAYIQVHKNATKWRGKQFPHYWDLCVVFGKDRANERDAQTAADIISEMENEQHEHEDHTRVFGYGLEDMNIYSQLNTPNVVPCEESSNIQRKRRRSNNWDPLLSTLKETTDVIGSKIEEATKNFIRIETERDELRKTLNGEMIKVAGLTDRECNKAVRMLSRDEDLMVVFFTINDEKRLGWIKDLLYDDV